MKLFISPSLIYLIDLLCDLYGVGVWCRRNIHNY